MSDNSGHVFFEGVPAGEYILKETKVPSDEYTVNSTEIPVTILGNQMNYPENLPNEDNIASVGQAPVYENVSEKGTFKFRKEDSTDHKTLLELNLCCTVPLKMKPQRFRKKVRQYNIMAMIISL